LSTTPETSSWPHLSSALTEHGWAHSSTFLSPALVTALRNWGHRHQATLKNAGTGQGADFRANSVRGDRIRWLDGINGEPAEQALGQQLEALRQSLNRTLFLNLVDVEAHVAVYAPGQGYARHRDRFRQDDRRQVSLVVYLNDDWTPDQGGALRLHVTKGPVDCFPQAGHAVAFLSGEIEHEVLPATRDRWSVAAWFRSR
jgi:SM-20-related protein